MKRFMSELVALGIRGQSEDGVGIVVPGPSPVSDIATPGTEGSLLGAPGVAAHRSLAALAGTFI